MKQNFFFLAFAAVQALTWAQTQQPPASTTSPLITSLKGMESSQGKKTQQLGIQPLPSANQPVNLYSNTMADCADWVFGNGSNEVGQPWTGIDLNFMCSMVGPSGSYNAWAGGAGDGTAAPPLNSTTSEDGILLIDSDLYGGESNYAANWVENSWAQTAESIDCSQSAYVTLSMETRYRCWDNGSSDGSEKCFVEVSRDGVTWPTLSSDYVNAWSSEGLVNYDGNMVQCRYNVFPESETGFVTGNPSIVQLDLSEAASGQSTIWIRFRWVGTWGYSWEIDDVNVFESLQNDLAIDSYVSSTNYLETSLYEYGVWAQSQIPSNLQAGVKVKNNGSLNQINVSVDLDVNGSVYPSTPLNLLPYGASDTLSIPYQLVGLGTQTLTYSLSATAMDENPIDNVFVETLEVDPWQFGRDDGVSTGPFPTDGVDDFIAMTPFDIINDVTIYAIDVAILSGSVEGTPVRGVLYNMFDGATFGSAYGGQLVATSTQPLAPGFANEIGEEVTWYTLVLDEPYQATAGQWIGAAFEHFGGTTLQIGEAQETYDQTAFVYGPFGAGDVYDWYYTNDVPMVRLNFNPNAQPGTVVGCLDETACNYDPSANVDGGTCDYSCPTPGCMYPLATNFNASANLEDGSCLFLGCTDPVANNYQYYANVDDGSCDYQPCAAACPGDLNGDNLVGTSDLLELLTTYGLVCE